MKVVQDFSQGKMNKDADVRYLPKGQYRHLLNGRVLDGSYENSGVIEAIAGTEVITEEPLLLDENDDVIGTVLGVTAFEDDIYCIGFREGEGTFIVKYDTITNQRQVILKDFSNPHLFPFNKSTVISAIHKYENLLIFHDKNVHDPYKINLDLVSEDRSYYDDGPEAMVIKRQPDMPEVVVGFDDDLSAPNFNNNVFWFAYRYVYEDGEVSAISPYSAPRITTKENTEKKDTNVLSLALISAQDNVMNLYAGTYNPDTTDKLHLVKWDGNVEDDKLRGLSYIESLNLMYISLPEKVLLYDGLGFTEIGRSDDFTPDSGHARFGGIAVNSSNSIVLLTSGTDRPGSKEFAIHKYNQQTKLWDRVFHTTESKYDTDPGYCDVVMSSLGNYAFARNLTQVFRSNNFGKENSWEEAFNLRAKIDNDDSSNIDDICCSAEGRIVYVCATGMHEETSTTYSGYLFRSMDYGKTFDKIGGGLPLKSDGGAMGCSKDGRIICMFGYVSVDYGDSFIPCFDYDANGYFNFPILGKLTHAKHQKQVAVSWAGENISMGAKTPYSSMSHLVDFILTSNEFGYKDTWEWVNLQGIGSLKSSMIQYGIPPSGIDNSLYFINDMSNYVDVKYFSGNKHIKAVDILMKSGSTMYKIVRINKKDNGISDDTFETYRFVNTGLYNIIPEKDALKLFDNVPLSAGTSAIIQNALMFGNYTEGFDTDRISSYIEVGIEHLKFERGDISLKSGTKQRYGIVYYDYFGRCTPVLKNVDVVVDKLTKWKGEEKRIARIKIHGKAPDWAVKYKIARGTPNISFDFIAGFTNVYAVEDKLYLEITGFPWIQPKAGDYIELIGNSTGEDVPNLIIPVYDYLDSSENTELSITLSDGSHIISESNKTVSPVPPGRYIVVIPPGLEHFTFSDVVAGKDNYASSNFYIVYEDATVSDVLFNEVPYDFRIENSLHRGNSKDQTEEQDYAECFLELDGDVVLMDDPVRELNRYPSRSIFTTLGRTIGKVENYRRIHRFAGLCVSEPYVEDTKYNGLSSFNTALLNYKDLEKNHRDIELIDGFDTNVEVYQRDKVSVVQYRKNVLATASGEKMVAQSQDIFGEQQMYAADYGMDNFRSYAKSGTSRYFVDSSRGAVLRKDVNGIVPISRYGMEGWLFDGLTQNGCIAGTYDSRHNSYILCLKNQAVNFLETNNGWSSFFSFIPDAICSTNSGVFSFKDGVLYRHNVKGSSTIYGEETDLVIRFVCNDFPDVIKVFNAIMVETSIVPSRVVLITEAGESEIDSPLFERKEGLYLAYIPMCQGEEGAEYVMAGVCRTNYSGSSIPLLNQTFTAIHIGDAVYKMSPGTEEITRIGKVAGIGEGRIDVDKGIDLNAGDYVICADLSQINGSMHRGRHMEIEMHFNTANGLYIKSVQTDIDESKV